MSFLQPKDTICLSGTWHHQIWKWSILLQVVTGMLLPNKSEDTQHSQLGLSVAAAKKTAFLEKWCSMGNKNATITEIFDKVDHFRNRGVIYWAKRNRPPVVQIIDRLQNPIKKLLFLLVNYLDNPWPVSFKWLFGFKAIAKQLPFWATQSDLFKENLPWRYIIQHGISSKTQYMYP